MPGFAEFHAALHGFEPFPWQRSLAERADHVWPSELAIPTGLGKTTCIDIAVWRLAAQAHLAPRKRTAPTRTWWVVNRRLLVDAAHARAKRLKSALADAKGDTPIARVAARLRRLSATLGAPPLEVVRLRGGVSASLPSDASQPAVLLSTLPQYGSRVLFRGYGARRGMLPIWAALAYCDSLTLLDEAHLAPHLSALLDAAHECMPPNGGDNGIVLPSARAKPQFAALTATGHGAQNRFTLDDVDEANVIVRQRLDASKKLSVLDCSERRMAQCLADAAEGLLSGLGRPASGIVFANSPRTARDAFESLRGRKSMRSAHVELLTGMARERDAAGIRQRLLDETTGMAAQRKTREREASLVVVATQTLEVGADLDADFLVTESCGARALTQRLGRLNRMGMLNEAQAVMLHGWDAGKFKAAGGDGCELLNTALLPEPHKPSHIYGDEPHLLRQRLGKALESQSCDSLDASPRRVAQTLGPPQDDPGRAAELMPALLWEWVKTTTPPVGEAPVEPYFAGIQRSLPTVSVIWRALAPKDGERLWPRVRNDETVDVHLWEMRDALGDDAEIVRLERGNGLRLEKCSANELRTGDVVALRADGFLIDKWGWCATAEAGHPVADVSLTGQGVPLDADALSLLWPAGSPVGSDLLRLALSDPDDGDDDGDAAKMSAVLRIVESLEDAPPPLGWSAAEWGRFTGCLSPEIECGEHEPPRLVANGRGVEAEREALDEDGDETSLASAPTGLERHGLDASAWAAASCELLGLPDGLARTVAAAAEFHDVGKADMRFQRWLDPDGRAAGLLAKSDRPRGRWRSDRVASGWPAGGRHEALSARLVEDFLAKRPDIPDGELLLHLVLSHHGFGRPWIPPVKDGCGMSVNAQLHGASVSAPADLERTDWRQPRRFNDLCERFGPWGLALLESILRLADFGVSRTCGGDA